MLREQFYAPQVQTVLHCKVSKMHWSTSWAHRCRYRRVTQPSNCRASQPTNVRGREKISRCHHAQLSSMPSRLAAGTRHLLPWPLNAARELTFAHWPTILANTWAAAPPCIRSFVPAADHSSYLKASHSINLPTPLQCRLHREAMARIR